ncbi:hypothetical protein EDB92DRAFT_286476 [Lactarius akahatsu]|uniref:Uncharacterized protein n=1 Tax=Lactarius akahatsu TaxID=416441 RepID=A0AAD4QF00_9AGAM|nr:hypothetical protein EDB92DRAFT_286476 [Lactarius akahatsu]
MFDSNTGPLRGRFSHLATFCSGTLLFILGYTTVTLYRVFAGPQSGASPLLMIPRNQHCCSVLRHDVHVHVGVNSPELRVSPASCTHGKWCGSERSLACAVLSACIIYLITIRMEGVRRFQWP